MPTPFRKGRESAFTPLIHEAFDEVAAFAADLYESYGIPLFWKLPGRGGQDELRWPEDPDAMQPEEMAQLIHVHGEEQVRTWLLEHYAAKAAQEIE